MDGWTGEHLDEWTDGRTERRTTVTTIQRPSSQTFLVTAPIVLKCLADISGEAFQCIQGIFYFRTTIIDNNGR